jgi:hypothetical protein
MGKIGWEAPAFGGGYCFHIRRCQLQVLAGRHFLHEHRRERPAGHRPLSSFALETVWVPWSRINASSAWRPAPVAEDEALAGSPRASWLVPTPELAEVPGWPRPRAAAGGTRQRRGRVPTEPVQGHRAGRGGNASPGMIARATLWFARRAPPDRVCLSIAVSGRSGATSLVCSSIASPDRSGAGASEVHCGEGREPHRGRRTELAAWVSGGDLRQLRHSVAGPRCDRRAPGRSSSCSTGVWGALVGAGAGRQGAHPEQVGRCEQGRRDKPAIRAGSW